MYNRPYLTVLPASYLTPNIKEVQFYDFETKQSTNITGNWKLNNCETNIESISTSYPSNCQFDSTNYSSSSSLVICRNAIKSIDYTFTHSQSTSSSIQKVDVYVTLQDILFDINSTTTINTALPSLQQSYSIQWTDNPSSSAISNSSGNVIKR